MQKTSITENYSISKILKGGWQLSQGHSDSDKSSAISDMFKFVEAGITTFDFGDIYTGVEELVGQFLNQYTDTYGKDHLQDIQLHTKYVPDLSQLSTVTKKDTEEIIDRSLKRLGVDRLDVVQFHWWDYDIPRYVEVANYLKELQEKGKIRYIGVTNFDVPHLKEIIDSGVVITTAQVQYSLLDHRPENGLVDFCQKNNIQLLCYGTVAGGFLSEKYLGADEPTGVLENRSLTKYKLIIDEFGGWELFQELLKTLSKISQKHQVSLTNVAERYILEKPQVAGIIVGARNAEHLTNNLQIDTFKLDQNDFEMIEQVIDQSPGLQGDCYELEREKGGKHAVIMKYNLNKD